jgi:hypothetical protein
MAGYQILGTCSLCDGAVVVPTHWAGTQPPIPACMKCGATKKRPHGNVIEMEPQPRRPVRVMTKGFVNDFDFTF